MGVLPNGMSGSSFTLEMIGQPLQTLGRASSIYGLIHRPENVRTLMTAIYNHRVVHS